MVIPTPTSAANIACIIIVPVPGSKYAYASETNNSQIRDNERNRTNKEYFFINNLKI